jgi:toxin ParE1/3/4
MPVILKRPRATDDLIELWDYIADDNVARADAFIDDVDAKLHLLAEQPMLGRSREEWLRAYEAFRSGDM